MINKKRTIETAQIQPGKAIKELQRVRAVRFVYRAEPNRERFGFEGESEEILYLTVPAVMGLYDKIKRLEKRVKELEGKKLK